MWHLREAEKHIRLAWSLMAEEQDAEDRAWQNILELIRESGVGSESDTSDPGQVSSPTVLSTHAFAPREDATGVCDDEPPSREP